MLSLEMIEDILKAIAFQEQKLKEADWDYTIEWIDPETSKKMSTERAYITLILREAGKRGWKSIKEIKRIGKLEWNKPLEEWERYQSPVTKRIYSFLELESIFVDGWKEDIWLDRCSKHTKELNQLIGNNFEGNEIKTWFYRKSDGEYTLELW